MTFPSKEQVIDEVNSSFDSLFRKIGENQFQPYVCCFCNELLLTEHDRAFMKTNLLYKKNMF